MRQAGRVSRGWAGWSSDGAPAPSVPRPLLIRSKISSRWTATVFGALIGFTAYVWLLHHVSVAKVATYAYVNPIVASILGIWLLHEGMGVYEWTGMFVILAAVALVNLSKVKKTA